MPSAAGLYAPTKLRAFLAERRERECRTRDVRRHARSKERVVQRGGVPNPRLQADCRIEVSRVVGRVGIEPTTL